MGITYCEILNRLKVTHTSIKYICKHNYNKSNDTPFNDKQLLFYYFYLTDTFCILQHNAYQIEKIKKTKIYMIRHYIIKFRPNDIFTTNKDRHRILSGLIVAMDAYVNQIIYIAHK